MTLLVDRARPAPAGTTAPSPSSRRRWRLAAVVLGLLAAYAALPVFVRLEGAAPEVPAGAGLEVGRFGTTGSVFLHYEHGRTVTVTVPLHNPTALPVSIGRLDAPPHSEPLAALESSSDPGTIPPFATREVELTFRFDNCRYYHERAAQTIDHLTVAGSTLGRDVTTEVPLAEQLVVHGQVILDCPDRTLVRGDDLR